MTNIVRFPVLVFVLSFVGLWLSVRLGFFLRTKLRPLDQAEREDFNVVQGATLTLLGLIIGFSFSMAISRYDLRKSDEAVEANVIGTEYLRADLLPAPDAARVRELLQKYLAHRIAFYEARDPGLVEQINRETEQLQTEMWSSVRASATKQPTPVVALAVSGMNEVLDSQGYTQAAWENRIPVAAWNLMVAVAVFGSLLTGNGAHRVRTLLFPVLPLVISTAFFLIADLDSPRRGIIRTHPHNLLNLSESLNGVKGN